VAGTQTIAMSVILPLRSQLLSLQIGQRNAGSDVHGLFLLLLIEEPLSVRIPARMKSGSRLQPTYTPVVSRYCGQ